MNDSYGETSGFSPIVGEELETVNGGYLFQKDGPCVDPGQTLYLLVEVVTSSKRK